MGDRCRKLGLVWLVLTFASVGAAQENCITTARPPKLPVIRASGRYEASGALVRVTQTSGIADSWKPTRREIGSVPDGAMVEVLEDVIVVDSPDIVRVTVPMDGLNLKEGDTILRYAHLGEGWADFWANGCWYKGADAGFITEPDGRGCGGSACSAKVTKMGRQMWWFKVRLPNGKVGWTLSQALDLSPGG